MADVKDKIVTAESLKALHDYDEATYVKKDGALNIIGAASNPNLLDNWYFADPINQRGGEYIILSGTPYYAVTSGYPYVGVTDNYYKVSYIDGSGNPHVQINGTEYFVKADENPDGFGIGYTGFKYTVDRWRTTNDGDVVVLLNGGVHISNQIRQFIENYNDVLNKELTASVLTSDGSLYTGTYTPVADGGSGQKIYEDEDIHFYFWIGKNEDIVTDISFIIQCKNPEKIKKIQSAKLEFGSVQTLCRKDVNGDWILNDPSPNKQQELAKCQRYFNRLKAEKDTVTHVGLALAGTTVAASAIINLPVSLRTAPSVSMADSVILRKGSVDVPVASVDFNNYSNNAIYVNLITTNNSLDIDSIYMVRLVGGYIDISADL